jgi:hypothetical protein
MIKGRAATLGLRDWDGRTADPSAALRDDKKERVVVRRGLLPRDRTIVKTGCLLGPAEAFSF